MPLGITPLFTCGWSMCTPSCVGSALWTHYTLSYLKKGNICTCTFFFLAHRTKSAFVTWITYTCICIFISFPKVDLEITLNFIKPSWIPVKTKLWCSFPFFVLVYLKANFFAMLFYSLKTFSLMKTTE